MSADNWGKCPKCVDKIIKDQRAKKEAAISVYGKATIDQFLEQYHESEKVKGIENTLREDYEFYHHDGILDIDYRCKCSECGFNFTYKKEITTFTVRGEK